MLCSTCCSLDLCLDLSLDIVELSDVLAVEVLVLLVPQRGDMQRLMVEMVKYYLHAVKPRGLESNKGRTDAVVNHCWLEFRI